MQRNINRHIVNKSKDTVEQKVIALLTVIIAVVKVLKPEVITDLKKKDMQEDIDTLLKEISELGLEIELKNELNQVDKISLETFKNLIDDIDRKSFDSAAIIDLMDNYSNYRGEYTTPNHLSKLMIDLAEVKVSDKILDPTAGLGSVIRQLISANPNQEIVAQEEDYITFIILKLSVLILGADKFIAYCDDVLENPLYTDKVTDQLETFDKVITVPPSPFGMTNQHDLTLDKFNRFEYGIPPRNAADWAFISNGIAALNSRGKAVFLVPNGSLFREGKAIITIRGEVINSDLIEAVIELPEGMLLPFANVATSILIINKNKTIQRVKKILMVNATDFKVSRRSENYKQLLNEHFDKIIDAYLSGKEISGFSKYVSASDIKDTVILPSRYVFSNKMVINGYGTLVFDFEKFKQMSPVILGNIANISRGYNLISKEESVEGAYRVVRISDIVEETINETSLSRITPSNITHIEKYEVKPGDILLSVRGVVIKVILVDKKIDNLLFNSNLVRIRVNSSKISSEWLLEYLKSPIGMAQLEMMMEGATVQQISFKRLSNLQVPLITLEEQKISIQKFQNKKLKLQEQFQILKREETILKNKLFSDMGISEFFKRTENDTDMS
ncbi:hypothetical protein RyT2_03080 [Pseudolactococcus yaeyamensis]